MPLCNTREAREKCEDLLSIPPSYDDYIYYTGEVKKIYRRYSDHVESFGLDEAWIDYTDSAKLFGDPENIVRKIQTEVKREIGLDVSAGLSWNKIFAKFGSDYKKPDAITQITKRNYQQIVWDSPVGELLYVGRATKAKLYRYGIRTIGELAQTDPAFIQSILGKMGHTERSGEYLYKNIPGDKYQPLFEGGMDYFR